MQALGATGAAGLAGCMGGGGGGGGGNNNSSSSYKVEGTATPADVSQAKMGGELIATIGADVKNYDPVRSSDTTSTKVTQGPIYESLMTNRFDGKPVPKLAKSVEQAGDKTTFDITLHEGVKFHNGSEMTAQDVKTSFERYKGTPRESDVYRWYGSSTIQDKYNLRVKLSRPYAPFKISGLPNVPIVPAEAAEKGSGVDLSKEPVGTGPYTFVTHNPDSNFVIERNDNYWQQGGESVPKKPPIERVNFKVIVEQASQLSALKAGNVDLINDPPADSLKSLAGQQKFTVTDRHAGGFDFLIFPMGSEAFSNKKIRRGVTRLIPRPQIMKSVYNGLGQKAYTPVAPLARQFTDSGEMVKFADESFTKEMKNKYVGYDTQKATQKLKQGFQEVGLSKPYKTTLITNQNPQRKKWCQLIQESLNGTDYFQVDLQTFEWNTYLQKIAKKNAYKKNQLIALGWSAGWDPDNYVHNILGSDSFGPACCNYSHYSNIDSLLKKGLNTYDAKQRQQIYKKIQRQVAKDSPIATVRFGVETDAFLSDTVHGFATYPINGAEYKSIYAPAAGRFTYVTKNQ